MCILRMLPAWILAGVFIANLAAADTVEFADPEFQINTTTTLQQRDAHVAPLAGGRSIVVWWTQGGGQGDYSIRGRLFESDGSPVGDDFLIRMPPFINSITVDVAAEPGGGFMVVWEEQLEGISSIYRHHYDADGLTVEGPIEVNSLTAGIRFHPAVSVWDDGRFVVVWTSRGSPMGPFDITGRLFNAEREPISLDLILTTSGEADRADVLAMTGDDFWLFWEHESDSGGAGPDHVAINARRFAGSGLPVGDELQVNTFAAGAQASPTADRSAADDFVVVWRSFGSPTSDTDNQSVLARRFGSDGQPIGTDFQVNTYTTGAQSWPGVEMSPDGSFAVVWESAAEPDPGGFNNHGIRFQCFAADGSLVGAELAINSYTPGSQTHPEISRMADGGFFVVWDTPEVAAGDADEFEVVGRRLSMPLFVDGFESGDTSAWK